MHILYTLPATVQGSLAPTLADCQANQLVMCIPTQLLLCQAAAILCFYSPLLFHNCLKTIFEIYRIRIIIQI